jgi:DNA-binding HxlR family transcriptional regulator
MMTKQPKRDKTRELAEELDVLDTMLSSLVELLEEKGILAQEEFEERVRVKSSKAGGFTNYRDIQFDKRK